MLGLGLLAWSLGDLVLAIESAGGATPLSPSVADAFYLCFYPITYVALMLLVRRKVGGLSRCHVARRRRGRFGGRGDLRSIRVPRRVAHGGWRPRVGGRQPRLPDRRHPVAGDGRRRHHDPSRPHEGSLAAAGGRLHAQRLRGYGQPVPQRDRGIASRHAVRRDRLADIHPLDLGLDVAQVHPPRGLVQERAPGFVLPHSRPARP